MKKNLTQARKTTPVPVTDNELIKMMSSGISKKAITTFFSISYQELKHRTQSGVGA
ncbi:hypothetical protein AB6E53_02400 [Vibrio breoganii]|nr:hypothetical protein [Vibrio breoganii]